MDGLILLDRAREAGLAVVAESDKLVIRGPRRAESVARLMIEHKPEVLAALAEAADWHARHREALAYRRAFHPQSEAKELAWAELVDRWHLQHGERVPTSICAGCRRQIGNIEALPLCDGARVHISNFDCLIQHGRRWRSVAANGLIKLGLEPPKTGQEAL
jgi:hypothetical protein